MSRPELVSQKSPKKAHQGDKHPNPNALRVQVEEAYSSVVLTCVSHTLQPACAARQRFKGAEACHSPDMVCYPNLQRLAKQSAS